MTGYSSYEPEQIILHDGGYQVRYDIEQVERLTDDGPVLEWRYEYINIANIEGDAADFYAQAVKQRLIDGVQAHLDQVAQSMGYDHILSLCSYATSADLSFAAEGQAGVVWRDAVWRYGYQVLLEVESGSRPTPLLRDLLAELPARGVLA